MARNRHGQLEWFVDPGRIFQSRVSRSRLIPEILLIGVIAGSGFVLSVRLRTLLEWKPAGQPTPFYLDPWSITAVVLVIGFAIISLRRLLELEGMTLKLRALYETSQLVSSTLNPDMVIRQVVEAARALMGYSYVAVMTLQDDQLVPTAWAGYPSQPPVLHVGQGVTGRVARTGRPAFVPDVRRDPDCVPALSGIGSEIAFPIIVDGQIAGVLNVEAAGRRRLSEEDAEVIGSLALQLSVALHNALRHTQVQERALRDSLTGLYDHAAFHERLREELARARRFDRPLALVMADLDNFKDINDTHGHLEGDRCLQLFASMMRRTVRSEDVVARYGGEEFAIIMPDTTKEEARLATERICRQVERDGHVRLGASDVLITGSFGISAFPEDSDDPTLLIRRADEALYAAKRSGKNCVRTAGQSAATQNPAPTLNRGL